MARLSLVRKTLRDLRWQVIWYGIGLAAMCMLVVFIYPSYQDQLGDFQIPEALQPLIGDANYATGEGFLTAEFFSWGPLMGLVFAIMAGTALLGGEEASGTLDLLLAQPISRRRLLFEKVAAFVVAAILIAVAIDIGWLLSVPFVDIDVSLPTLMLATFLMVPLILLVGMFAVWATAILPNRKLATGLVTFVVVASFFVNYLSELVDVLKPLAWASFFHYQNSAVLTKGFEPVDLAVLLIAAGVFAGLALRALEARDIAVHDGQWSMPSLPGERDKSEAGDAPTAVIPQEQR